jgi:hypothetical protein
MARRIRESVTRCMRCRQPFVGEMDQATCIWCGQTTCLSCMEPFDPLLCRHCSHAIAHDDEPAEPRPYRPLDGRPLFELLSR